MQRYLKQQKYTYNEDDLLGQGSFGKVYKGYNFHTNKHVALKQIQLSKIVKQGQEMLKNILFSQITVMRKFNKKMKQNPCPFLVRQEDVFRTDKHIYIVMEICEGGTLQDEIRGKRFKEKECIQVLYCMCRGLAYMNQMGIVHRDLKPQNIFISTVKLGKGEGKQNKIYKIGDFGFAAQKQQFQTAMGTFPYMAPEMFKKQKYNNKVDVWSLGIIAYEIMFSGLYFLGKDKWQIQKNIKQKQFILNQRQKNQISKQYQDFLYKCLVKEPKNRMAVNQLLTHPIFNDIHKWLKAIQNTVFESKKPQLQSSSQLKKIASQDYKQQKIYDQTDKEMSKSVKVTPQIQQNQHKLEQNSQKKQNIDVFDKLSHLIQQCVKMRQMAQQYHQLSSQVGHQTQFIQVYLLKDSYVMMNRLTYSILHKQNHLQLMQTQFSEFLNPDNSHKHQKLQQKSMKQCMHITGLFNEKYKHFMSYINKFREDDQQLISKVVNEQPYDFVNSAVLQKELKKWVSVFQSNNPEYIKYNKLKEESIRILNMKIQG